MGRCKEKVCAHRECAEAAVEKMDSNSASVAGSIALMEELKMEMITIINREMMSDYQTLVGADKRFVVEWIRNFFDNKITGIEVGD